MVDEEKKESPQDEVDELLKEVSGLIEKKQQKEEKQELKQEEVDQLLKGAGIISETKTKSDTRQIPKEIQPIKMETFTESKASAESLLTIDMLQDIDLKLTVELGRCKMLINDILKIGKNSVIELDKLAGDPLNIYVNNKLIAKGEVLVLNDNFCIRITEIVSPKETIEEE